MYHAKKNGRHIYRFFKPEMIVEPVERQFVQRDHAARQGISKLSFRARVRTFIHRAGPS